jgi:hypothetical protein
VVYGSASNLTITRASPHPAAMYWGEELVAIYNEAYIGLCLCLAMHVQLANIKDRSGWAEAS